MSQPDAEGRREPTESRIAYWFVCSLFCLALAAFLFTLFVLSRENTLEMNGRWRTTKAEQATPLMGSHSYFTSTQALARNRLNLGAWHGFQEVIFRQSVIPVEVGFRFQVIPRAYVVFLFNVDSEGFEGIFLSGREDMPNAYIRGLRTGEWLERRELAFPVFAVDEWHTCTLTLSGDGTTVTVDDTTVSIPSFLPQEAKCVGFRGCYEPSFVDDLRLTEASGEVCEESFENNLSPGRILRLAVLFVVGCAVLALLLKVISRSWRRAVQWLVAVSLSLLVGGGAVFLCSHYYLAQRYPTVRGYIARCEEHRLQSQLDSTERRLRGDGQRMAPLDTQRVLFLGSSQTYGDGAQTAEQGVVPVLERALNGSAGPGTPVKCLNAAVRGASGAHLVALYEDLFEDLDLDLTVVNLGCNDFCQYVPLELFETELKQLVALNEEAGIATLFVLEAASVEVHPDGFPGTHETMRRVGEELGVPVVDAHAYTKAHQFDGFIFWDLVHPTTFGHRLLADCLFPDIVRILEEGAQSRQEATGSADRRASPADSD